MIETFGLAIVALLPFLAAPIVAYLAKYNRLAAAWSSAAATIMAFLVLLFYIKLPFAGITTIQSWSWIESIGLNYGNNFGTQSIGGNFMRLKPMGKYGVAGFGVNYTYMFGGLVSKPMASMGYNLLYTNSFVKDEGRLTYAPAFIVSQTPISFTLDKNSNVSKDAMFILSNSFLVSSSFIFSIVASDVFTVIS